MPSTFDLQGHRGARGLLPENTIPAFLLAVELGVTTVELDVVVTRDRRLVASHDPWFDPRICSHPDGRLVTEADRERLAIYRLDYDDVAAFDCGRRGHPDFPRQRPLAVSKPLLSDAVRAVEARVRELGRPPVGYNIETKSRPEWDGTLQAPPEEFVRLLYDELAALGVLERTIVQSFDVRTLQVLRALDPSVVTSLLVEAEKGAGNADRSAAVAGPAPADSPPAPAAPAGTEGDATSPPAATRLGYDFARLGFVPAIYSPDYRLVDAALVAEAHAAGMRVIPWTVNDAEAMARLIGLGVDGLITDYPDVGVEVVARLGLAAPRSESGL